MTAQHAVEQTAAAHWRFRGSKFSTAVASLPFLHEDLLQLLVSEFVLDALPGWEQAVAEGRAPWRRTLARAVTRDFPEQAADVLRQLGYQVSAPTPPPATDEKALTAW